MTTKEEQLSELARLASSPCEMNWNGECVEGKDCTKCGVATEAAGAIYDAGYRKIAIDDFPNCALSGCEAASKDCHKTCPDSVQNKTARELKGKKEIIDFALDIYHAAGFGLEMSATLAEDLAARGYRKASDVVREIAEQFKEIAKQYLLEKGLYLAVFRNALNHTEAELKKKYESEGADDGSN